MPLDAYGVLVGTLHASYRDMPDSQGRWFHVNMEVDAPAGRYRCAVDVDSKQSNVGVKWKKFVVQPDALGPAVTMPSGYHDLLCRPGSGALDYIRHLGLRVSTGCVFIRRPEAWLQSLLELLTSGRRWIAGSNLDAAAVLEPMLVAGREVLVFGEPFTTGLGIHNIHQNQGDPQGSQWWAENGIWQDGATAVVRPDGALDVFISKFSTQTDRTDTDGHPT